FTIKPQKHLRKPPTNGSPPAKSRSPATPSKKTNPASIESVAGGCVRAALAEPRPGHPPSPQGRGFPFRSAAVAPVTSRHQPSLRQPSNPPLRSVRGGRRH